MAGTRRHLGLCSCCRLLLPMSLTIKRQFLPRLVSPQRTYCMTRHWHARHRICSLIILADGALRSKADWLPAPS